MSLVEYTLLTISSLFVIMDPIATVPTFLAMTPDDTPEQRTRMAGLACQVAAGLLVAFALLGHWIFHFLGISIPAFQMAGSVVLMLIALEMVRAEHSRTRSTEEEVEAGAAKTDIAITPLGVPLLAGPGAISTVILLQSKASDWIQRCVLVVSIGVVCFAAYVILVISSRGAQWLSPIVLRLATRIMGVLLAAIACQFFLNALRGLGVIQFQDA